MVFSSASFTLCVILSLLALSRASDDCLIPIGVVPAGYCARKWATGLSDPRGILVLSNNDVLVVESGKNQVTLFYETISNSTITRHSVALAKASGLNHGVAFGNGYLYASSMTTVYRWAYTVGNRTPLGTAETVITGIPSAGHQTRTLLFDPNGGGSLLVSVGSNGNIDSSGIAGIYRFAISSLPTTYSSKTIVATGLRNEVGIKFDHIGNLWGVENGFDDLNRNDMGGDIHQQNPGEELNLFTGNEGKFFGYPYCWSMYNVSTLTTPRLTQYAHENFMNDGTHTDSWCQNTSNVVLPKYSIRAHTAPLDITFYNGTSFPGMNGDAFIASHGSWDRQPPAGYAIRHVKFTNGNPVSDENFFSYIGPGETGNGWVRPVGLDWARCDGSLDCLLMTDDQQGTIVAITYSSVCNCNNTIILPPSSGSSSSTAHATAPALCYFIVSMLLAIAAYL